jgi:hypothetical protein
MNKSNHLPVLAAEIMRAHAEARGAARMSLTHAIKAGEALIEAKGQLKHGEWLPWLKDKCELSERTAQVYMQLAAHGGQFSNTHDIADLTITGALEQIEAATALRRHAERIGQRSTIFFENLHGLVATLNDLRQSFENNEVFKQYLVSKGYADPAFVVALLESGSDAEWTDALLAALERSADAFQVEKRQ